MNDWIIETYPISHDREIIFVVDPVVSILTPIDVFVELFGLVIEEAVSKGVDVKQAIRDADPTNSYGFNDII